MVYGNKIVKKVAVEDFLEIMKEYSKDQIVCTNHTFIRLSEKQKKEFTCELLQEYLFHEIPIQVGIQDNNNYAVYYKYKDTFMRLILDIVVARKINIVTFYLPEGELPRI